jgi:hypothetical protein
MKRFLAVIYKTDISFHVISGVVLAFMMCLTLADVIARNLGYPMAVPS